MRRNVLAALLALFIATAALLFAQVGIKIRDFPTDVSPASTDLFVKAKAGGTTVSESRGSLLSGFVNTTTPQAQNSLFAGPGSGGAGAPSFRSLVAADIPNLWTSQVANLLWASPSGSSGVPSFRALTAADIALGLITYSKIQNISTGGLLLGRYTSAGAGAMQEVSLGSGLAMSSGGVLSATGTGTVSSVGLTVPSWLTVSGSPVTAAGTLGVTAAGSQASHLVIGTCGSATSFSPCALVAGDLPLVSLSTGVNGTLQAAQFPALTGAVTTSAGSLSTSLASSLTIVTPTLTSPIANSPVLNTATIGTAGTSGSSHIKSAGTAPTIGSCTGLGTGTCAVVGTDALMEVTLSPATTGSASGTFTVTYNGAYATNAPVCIAQLVSGTGAWSTVALPVENVSPATSSTGWEWNNSVGITAGQTYKIDIFCGQR